jgi:tetratricopeptide (TPR) repeat protein
LWNWYRNHAPNAGIQTASYFELRSFRGVTIVNPTSAHPGTGADPVGLDEDHISIAKPRERDAQVCGAARDLLRNYVLATRPAPREMTSPSPRTPTPGPSVTLRIDATALGLPYSVPIPQELPPGAEEFFGRKIELELLTQRLRSRKNTAVVGPAGLGKTALAAKALLEVVGETSATLAVSPFPDGVVFLDLYTLHGAAEPTWDTLANKLAGTGFMERSPARERAMAACHTRRILIVIEGGEEADGQNGRARISEIRNVISPQNRWLLLTRLDTQAAAAETVMVKDALNAEDAKQLFDSLTHGQLTAAVHDRVLELLEGHPLALSWAGNMLARDDDDPEQLTGDWAAERLPTLSDPRQAEHTLEWLFNRSVRGLDNTSRQALEAAALLARAPFPVGAIEAALADTHPGGAGAVRQAIKSLVQRGLLRRAEEADHWQFTHVLGYRFARREIGSDRGIRVRLGAWLYAHLAATLATDFVGTGPAMTIRALEHLGALLRTDDDQSLWYPLANSAFYDFANRLWDVGRLGQVKLALGAIAEWLEGFPRDKAQEADWLRERSVLIERQGNVLRNQGDLAGALAAFRESLQVRRRLAEADPSNAGWQRDLSVSHNNVGNVLRDQGDLAGALAAFRESLQVSRRLAEADPSNAGWQRDLSFSLTQMAEFHRRNGERTEALGLAEESLRIDERLAALDPSNATWQKDVAVSRALAIRLRG